MIFLFAKMEAHSLFEFWVQKIIVSYFLEAEVNLFAQKVMITQSMKTHFSAFFMGCDDCKNRYSKN